LFNALINFNLYSNLERKFIMTDNILNSINIFSELSDEECKALQKFFKPRKYLKNSMIILEEEYGDLVFVVQSGTIKITRVNDEGKEVILALLGPGEIFGELAILDGEARSANALAQENCELMAINKEDFLDILKNNFSVSFNVMCELAKRLRKSDQQIEALSLSDAEHRIGVSLLNLAEDMGVIRKGKVTIQNLPFQQDIANMAGTSRETVSRVLKILENKSMISKEGHTLIIPDYTFFKQIFGKSI
jgi:CRP/FNR family cyclic AMP-dependent transcriptional regulator